MAPTFRDRFLTPKVARAMMSPLGILAAGAGAAAGILTGFGPVAAVAGGIAAWGTRVLVAVPRGPSRPEIDPSSLSQPWRRFVEEAVANRMRFDRAVRRARAGPLASRLQEIADRIDAGVDQSWEIAQRGQLLTEARGQVDVQTVRARLQEVQQKLAVPGSSSVRGTLEQTAQALDAQLAAARRMEDVISGADAQLRLLDARMAEAVTRAVELSARAGDASDLAGIGQDVEGVVSEMEALRQALDEASPGSALSGLA